MVNVVLALNTDTLNPDPDPSTIIIIKGTAPLTELRNLGLRAGQRVCLPGGKGDGVIVVFFKELGNLTTRPCAVIALDSPQLPTQDDGRYGECLLGTTNKTTPLSSAYVICYCLTACPV